jgi:hypothetical protein
MGIGGKLGHEPETLQDLLDDAGIRLGEAPRFDGKNHAGSRSRLYCPQCEGGRSKERHFYVLFDHDGQGFRYQCFRASCGVTGGRRLRGAPDAQARPLGASSPGRGPASPPTVRDRGPGVTSLMRKAGHSERSDWIRP